MATKKKNRGSVRTGSLEGSAAKHAEVDCDTYPGKDDSPIETDAQELDRLRERLSSANGHLREGIIRSAIKLSEASHRLADANHEIANVLNRVNAEL